MRPSTSATAGELFVIRNIAALVPAYEPDGRRHATSTALEYAVRSLRVSNILVLGHGGCGGIRAAIDTPDGPPGSDFLGPWMSDVRSLVAGLERGERDDAAFTRLVEHASVRHSLHRLQTFPWVRERYLAGVLDIVGAWFDIALAELHVVTDDGSRTVASV